MFKLATEPVCRGDSSGEGTRGPWHAVQNKGWVPNDPRASKLGWEQAERFVSITLWHWCGHYGCHGGAGAWGPSAEQTNPRKGAQDPELLYCTGRCLQGRKPVLLGEGTREPCNANRQGKGPGDFGICRQQ